MKMMFVVRYSESVHIPDIFLNLPGYTHSYTQGRVDQYYIGGVLAKFCASLTIGLLISHKSRLCS